MSESQSFGKYMRSLRQAKDLSLLDLSRETGLAYTHLSRIENDSGIPNPDTVVKLADALGGDLALMLDKANNLPRVIIDRLMQREAGGATTKMQRAIPASRDSDPSPAAVDLGRLLRQSDLSEEEKQDMTQAIAKLLLLPDSARRAIIQVITAYFPEEGDAKG